jgi:hypothetical protein
MLEFRGASRREALPNRDVDLAAFDFHGTTSYEGEYDAPMASQRDESTRVPEVHGWCDQFVHSPAHDTLRIGCGQTQHNVGEPASMSSRIMARVEVASS